MSVAAEPDLNEHAGGEGRRIVVVAARTMLLIDIGTLSIC
jgi:hypothetical protein